MKYSKPYDLDDLTGPFDKTDFPQRQIYLDLLPKAAAEFAPATQYWANSPFSGKGLAANDLTVGDIHQWDGKSLFEFLIVILRVHS